MPDIQIAYKGTDYTIREDRAFQIGERVEAIATLGEISGWQANPQYHRMARCVGEMLRFAGCKTADKDVFEELMKSLKAADGAFLGGVLVALINTLTHGMLIDETPAETPAEAPASGEIAPS